LSVALFLLRDKKVVGVFVRFRAPLHLEQKIENLVALQRQIANGFLSEQKN
jgi:hypothetical protein